jgi:hypothetical protein
MNAECKRYREHKGKRAQEHKAKGKKEQKKGKKLRNRGFLTVFLKNGVVGGSKKVDFIGLIRF